MISGHFFGAIDLASNPASPFSRRVTDLSLLSKNSIFLNLGFDHATGRNCQHRGRGPKLLDVVLNDKLKLRRSMG
jgi:hypothetical protein